MFTTALVTANLGLPSNSPCFFCSPAVHQSVILKEHLNAILHVYNITHPTLGSVQEAMTDWWYCINKLYRHLSNWENFQRNQPIYILIEKQQWLFSFAAIALECDFPIVEALAIHWPAYRITKRDIHEHLCSHKWHSGAFGISDFSRGNITPWATEVKIAF